MMDSLSVEFALVQDIELFNLNKKKWFGEAPTPESCPGESWGGEDHHNDADHQQMGGQMSTSGGCIIFTSPNLTPSDMKSGKSKKEILQDKMIKIDPSQLHFVDLQDPANFVKMLITAQHEHQSFISFSEQNIFTTSKIISWVAKSHPVVIIPSNVIESLDANDK